MMQKLLAGLLSMTLCLLSCCGVNASEGDSLEIHQINVGTADGCLIRYFEDGEDYNVLIDGGNGSNFLKNMEYRTNPKESVKAIDRCRAKAGVDITPELMSQLIDEIEDERGRTDTENDVLNYLNKLSFNGQPLKLDYVINSHPHNDHVSGLVSIAYLYDVDHFLMWADKGYFGVYTPYKKIVDHKAYDIDYNTQLTDQGTVSVSASGGSGKKHTLYYNNANDSLDVKEGATVKLSINPEKGYDVAGYMALTVNEGPHRETLSTKGNSFTMPDADIEIAASFKSQTNPAIDVHTPQENESFQLGDHGPIFTQIADTSEESRFKINTSTYANINNESLCWKITYAGRKIITGGDLQRAAQTKIIKDHGEDLARTDLYKQCHHGFTNADGYKSKTHSGHYAFALAVNARHTVVSYGAKTGIGVYGCTKKVLNDSTHSNVYKTYTQGTIVATITDDGQLTFNKKPAVKGKPTLTLAKSKITLYKGKSTTIKATERPYDNITYKSSNKAIATVDANGRITALKAGKTTIKVKANGITKKITLTVKKCKLTLKKTSLTIKKGKTATIKATAKPADTITYQSADETIATVSTKGKVTAVKKGKTTIKVKANGITKKVTIKVK